VAKKGKHWHVKNLQEELKEQLLKLIHSESDVNLEKHLLKVINETFPGAVETPFNMYRRSLNIKTFLKNNYLAK
jgi:hypothetical protein